MTSPQCMALTAAGSSCPTRARRNGILCTSHRSELEVRIIGLFWKSLKAAETITEVARLAPLSESGEPRNEANSVHREWVRLSMEREMALLGRADQQIGKLVVEKERRILKQLRSMEDTPLVVLSRQARGDARDPDQPTPQTGDA